MVLQERVNASFPSYLVNPFGVDPDWNLVFQHKIPIGIQVKWDDDEEILCRNQYYVFVKLEILLRKCFIGLSTSESVQMTQSRPDMSSRPALFGRWK